MSDFRKAAKLNMAGE